MQRDIHFPAIVRRLKHPAFLLIVFSGTSMVLGTLLAAFSDNSSLSWMRLAADSRLSIVCLFAVQLLPFLIAAYAVQISRLWLTYAVCSCKLFLFSCMGALIWAAFGSAGWLVRWLLLFPDLILVPVLCWFCFRCVLGRENARRRDFWLCIGVVAVTVMINLLFISPLLARSINI